MTEKTKKFDLEERSAQTKHWLRMIAVAALEQKIEARILWQEANELNLIFNSIIHKLI